MAYHRDQVVSARVFTYMQLAPHVQSEVEPPAAPVLHAPSRPCMRGSKALKTRVGERTQLPAHALHADVHAVAAQCVGGARRERLRACKCQAQHLTQRVQPPASAQPVTQHAPRSRTSGKQ